MTTYKFVNSFKETCANNEPNVNFYQIAAFADLETKLYHVRKFTINCSNEFISVRNHNISQRSLDKLIKLKKNNEYKLFPVYDLNYVDYPSLSDILLLKSDMLSNNYYHYGYAPINNSF
ncbi:hypothetical protein Indivirus_3_54 [Indivirus ILV1]|uniref:Uncharacterized protein n=1 Tax=Indivirus ILV1 TaxID=1977633 RepID=A0A1V0SDL6_9VIRU|nr:hypothetical protein Indivirus_3_54 [Indivirus ILV1]